VILDPQPCGAILRTPAKKSGESLIGCGLADRKILGKFAASAVPAKVILV
jgi:hypothetical protein